LATGTIAAVDPEPVATVAVEPGIGATAEVEPGFTGTFGLARVDGAFVGAELGEGTTTGDRLVAGWAIAVGGAATVEPTL
jgi:hypothetical protein